jgi:glyoxalase family protein
VSHPILGLHHVTATVDDAQDDLDFCLAVLGMRLLKKTVNFDNHHVYHFYYGDERGSPGTIWTTFPYKGWTVPVGSTGAGQVVATTFSVPAGSLGFWQDRLAAHGVTVAAGHSRFNDEVLAFRDPSGLMFEVIASGDDDRQSWQGTVGGESAVRGLHSVTLLVRSPQATVDLMTSVLGFATVDEMEGRIRVAVNGARPGHFIDILHDDHASPARNGIGTVHHVAMAIETDAQQLVLREELVGRGVQVTEVRDRQYFKSIYFREPGGVLLEVATMAPGFTVDEDLQSLGRDLKLPPWEEPLRREIEGHLPRISYV